MFSIIIVFNYAPGVEQVKEGKLIMNINHIRQNSTTGKFYFYTTRILLILV